MKRVALILSMFVLISSVAFADTSGSGRKSVTTAGTSVALSSTATPFNELTVCADPDNTGKISVGAAPVASTTIPQGVFLSAGECYSITRTVNGKLTEVKIDSTVNGESVSYEWQYR